MGPANIRGPQFRFRFRSPAGLAVTVTKVAAPCKCTGTVVRTPDAAKEQWGEIELTVNFGDVEGDKSVQVQVHLLTWKPLGDEEAAAALDLDAAGAAQQGRATDPRAAGRRDEDRATEDRKPAAKDHGDTAGTVEDGVAGDASSTRGEAAERKPEVVSLTLNAFVIKRGIRLKPARLVFPAVKPDARPSRKVRAEIVTRLVPAQVSKVCCSARWIEATIKEIAVEKDQRWAIAEVSAYELDVKLDPAKARRGRSFLEFVTLYTNATRWPFADLPIKAKVEE